MRSDTLLGLGKGGFHRIHYTDWGDPNHTHVAICLHGITRNGRDFDALAQALAPHMRVICPDVVGRGRSDWLQAKEDYGFPQYLADMTALIARVSANGVRRLDWVGTSMGGLVGMLIAAQPRSPLSRLVLNDVGMFIPQVALERIASYVGKSPRFATLAELEAYVRYVSAPFGPLTDDQWRHLTVHNARQTEDGSWTLGYDPDIAQPFRTGPLAAVDMSATWTAITCPTLLLRGADSDILPRDTALAMTQNGPRPQLIEFPGIGHAPMLLDEPQIAPVRDFLLA